VGNRVRVKVVKNKVAAPFRQAEFDIEFGKGVSTAGCLIDYGVEQSIITKSGAFFSYRDERLGQGRGNAKAFLEDHPEVAKEIEAKIYAALGLSRDLVKPIDSADQARSEGGNGASGDWREAPPARPATPRGGGDRASQGQRERATQQAA
jgi:recombination protein RecA